MPDDAIQLIRKHHLQGAYPFSIEQKAHSICCAKPLKFLLQLIILLICSMNASIQPASITDLEKLKKKNKI